MRSKCDIVKTKIPFFVQLTDACPNQNSIGELWEDLLSFTLSRCKDNLHYNGQYPLSVRDAQLTTLETLVKSIREFHEYAKNKN